MKNVAKRAVAVFALAVLGFMPAKAFAIPTLQLDIDGGTYDNTTETIVTGSGDFTLYAYLIENNSNRISDTYYLSVALSPSISTSSSLGSFTYNGTTVDVTSGMVYGVPPLETYLDADPGDLPTHGIYPTYYKEIAVTFSPSNTIEAYNTQDRAISGDPIPTGTTGSMYYAAFDIDISGLDPAYGLHFDLYNTSLARNSTTDIDVSKFAPFSHDAGTRQVPEPGTLLLLGSGLTGLYLSRRLRSGKKNQ